MLVSTLPAMPASVVYGLALRGATVRKPFNTTCDIFTGPAGTPPDTFVGSFPCRLVFQDGIHTTLIAGAEPALPYWLTIEGRCPRGMFVTPGVQLNTDAGDRVAVPQGSLVRFAVLYSDLIIWKDQTPYYRAYLMALPIPTPLKGGVIVAGLAVIVPPSGGTSGGVQCGGQVHILPGPAGGGVLLGGVAFVVPGSAYHPHGGVVVGGVAKVVPGSAYVTLGGVIVGGAAKWSPPDPPPILGGVIVGGAAKWSPPDPPPILGGVIVGGAATVSYTPGGPYVLDTYTDPDGTNPTSRPCDTGQVPTSPAGGYSILSHRCTNPTNASYTNQLVYESLHADCTVSADLQATQLINGFLYDGADLVFRWVSGSAYWIAQPFNGNLRLVVDNNFGSPVALGAYPFLNGVTYNVKIVLSGSSIIGYVNGSMVFSVSNSTHSTSTKHGIIIKSDLGTSGTAFADNFKVEA